MFCSKCGKEIPDGSVACNFCGTAIASTGAAVKEKVSLTTVFEWGIAFAIIGLIFGGIVGAVMAFIVGFIVAYAGASLYEAIAS